MRRRTVTDETYSRARELRQNSTVPERRLWSHLRARQLAGLKFVRQSPVGPFIVDFVCRDRQLAIELDGDSHTGRATYDRQRQNYLESQGLTVLRISNDDVLQNLDGVLFGVVRAAGLNPVAWQRGELGKFHQDSKGESVEPPNEN